MASLDTTNTLRLLDAIENFVDTARERAVREDADRREFREKLDNILRMLGDEKTTHAQLPQEIVDEVVKAFTTMLSNQRNELALAHGDTAAQLRHAIRNELQQHLNRTFVLDHAAVAGNAAAAGGETREITRKHALVVDDDGVFVGNSFLKKYGPWILGVGGAASGIVSWVWHNVLHR